MTQGNADITMNDRPVFSAELHPYRSLGRNGHRVFFLIAGALSFAHMAVFMISGAWPVVMFFGADFLILFGAFWLNNRAARAREVVSLSRHLLFFDARDPRQVKHARELNGRYAGRIKPILTGGSYLDLMKAWRVPVYYDQSGTLTRRFGIRQVPALVSQEGLRLRIDELGLP